MNGLLLLQVASVVSNSVQSHRQQSTRLCPWDSPSKNTAVGCHFLLQCVKVNSLLVQLLVTPQTAAYQAPLSMGFSRVLEWVAIAFSAYNGQMSNKGNVIESRYPLYKVPYFHCNHHHNNHHHHNYQISSNQD